MLPHAEERRRHLRAGFQARLASAAVRAAAHWIARVRSGQFLSALRARLAVTPQKARDRPEAAAAELSRVDRGIPATVLCRSAPVERTPLGCDRRTIGAQRLGSSLRERGSWWRNEVLRAAIFG